MNCAICHKPVTEDQSAIDHIKPGRFGGLNTTTVHLACNRRKKSLWQRLARRLGYIQWKFIMWLESWQMCHKESMGYRCKHEIHNGIKECGE